MSLLRLETQRKAALEEMMQKIKKREKKRKDNAAGVTTGYRLRTTGPGR